MGSGNGTEAMDIVIEKVNKNTLDDTVKKEETGRAGVKQGKFG